MNAFDRVAIDIVGALPESKRSGNRFLLTLINLCTHYPEAVALPQHDTKTVCLALSEIFTRFGFPKEILSDRGPKFMSDLMQQFVNQCGIQSIRTSAYHPQSNSSLERLNHILNNTIRSVVDQLDGE